MLVDGVPPALSTTCLLGAVPLRRQGIAHMTMGPVKPKEGINCWALRSS